MNEVVTRINEALKKAGLETARVEEEKSSYYLVVSNFSELNLAKSIFDTEYEEFLTKGGNGGTATPDQVQAG